MSLTCVTLPAENQLSTVGSEQGRPFGSADLQIRRKAARKLRRLADAVPAAKDHLNFIARELENPNGRMSEHTVTSIVTPIDQLLERGFSVALHPAAFACWSVINSEPLTANDVPDSVVTATGFVTVKLARPRYYPAPQIVSYSYYNDPVSDPEWDTVTMAGNRNDGTGLETLMFLPTPSLQEQGVPADAWETYRRARIVGYTIPAATTVALNSPDEHLAEAWETYLRNTAATALTRFTLQDPIENAWASELTNPNSSWAETSMTAIAEQLDNLIIDLATHVARNRPEGDYMGWSLTAHPAAVAVYAASHGLPLALWKGQLNATTKSFSAPLSGPIGYCDGCNKREYPWEYQLTNSDFEQVVVGLHTNQQNKHEYLNLFSTETFAILLALQGR